MYCSLGLRALYRISTISHVSPSSHGGHVAFKLLQYMCEFMYVGMGVCIYVYRLLNLCRIMIRLSVIYVEQCLVVCKGHFTHLQLQLKTH
jgi:hypothetical protein